MTTVELIHETQVCRLCSSRNTETDTVDIYSEKGKERDYLGKINRYLYLRVTENDAHPKTICWMCSNQLNTFHKFYEKVRNPLGQGCYFFFFLQYVKPLNGVCPLPNQINQIQKAVLKDDYEKNVLVPHFESPFDNVSSSEIEIFEEDCEDDTVEVVVLNTEDNYDDIDQHFEIEIQDDDQLANDSLAEKEKEVEPKFVLQSVVKKEKKIVQSSTRQTRSSNSKSPRTNKANTAQPIQSPEDISEIALTNLKEEESIPTASCSTDDVKNVFYYDVDDGAETDITPPSKKRRGRPKAVKAEGVEPDDSETVMPVKRYTRSKTTVQRKVNDLPLRDADEGESGDEFPARDSDNEDWPSQTTLDDFPNKIIENGLLLVKGKKLMSMICKYYKLECDLCEPKTRFK